MCGVPFSIYLFSYVEGGRRHSLFDLMATKLPPLGPTALAAMPALPPIVVGASPSRMGAMGALGGSKSSHSSPNISQRSQDLSSSSGATSVGSQRPPSELQAVASPPMVSLLPGVGAPTPPPSGLSSAPNRSLLLDSASCDGGETIHDGEVAVVLRRLAQLEDTLASAWKALQSSSSMNSLSSRQSPPPLQSGGAAGGGNHAAKMISISLMPVPWSTAAAHHAAHSPNSSAMARMMATSVNTAASTSSTRRSSLPNVAAPSMRAAPPPSNADAADAAPPPPHPPPPAAAAAPPMDPSTERGGARVATFIAPDGVTDPPRSPLRSRPSASRRRSFIVSEAPVRNEGDDAWALTECWRWATRWVPSRGLAEEHWLVTLFDVIFVITTMVGCVTTSLMIRNVWNDPQSLDTPVMVAVIFAVCEALSGISIVLRFFVAVRVGKWTIVDDLPSIRAHYLRRWFWLDLINVLPLEFIFFPWMPLLYNVMILRNFLRFARLFKLGVSSNPLKESRMWLRFMSLICVLVVLLAAASIIFVIAAPQYSVLQGTYWAVATITSVGYGDVVPFNEGGRVVSIFTMLLGVICMTTVTAYVTSFLTTQNPLDAEREMLKEKFHDTLAFYDVPWELQKEAIAAIPSAFEKLRSQSFHLTLESLPTGISKELFSYARATTLASYPPWSNVDRSELLLLVSALNVEHFKAQDIIYSQDDDASIMYFIAWGRVLLYADRDSQPQHPDGNGAWAAWPLAVDAENKTYVVQSVCSQDDYFGEDAATFAVRRPQQERRKGTPEDPSTSHSIDDTEPPPKRSQFASAFTDVELLSLARSDILSKATCCLMSGGRAKQLGGTRGSLSHRRSSIFLWADSKKDVTHSTIETNKSVRTLHAALVSQGIDREMQQKADGEHDDTLRQQPAVTLLNPLAAPA